MRVMTMNHVGTGIDQASRKWSLVLGEQAVGWSKKFWLDAPVKRNNHKIVFSL